MKTKKLTLFALGLVLVVALAGCTTNDSGFNNRLGTQTRIGNNGLGTDNWRGNNMSGNNGLLDNNMNDMNGMNGMNNGLNSDRLNNNLSNNGSMGNASELARRIAALPEVQSAAVVVSGNKAVVGLNLNGTDNNGMNSMNTRVNTGNLNTNLSTQNNQNNISSALRQRIETMVRDTNRNITSVSITTDPELFTRIQNMSNGTNNGGLMNTINNDIDDLIRRITPNNNGNMINR